MSFEHSEKMYVGSLIAYGDRATGYQLAEQFDLQPSSLATPALQSVLGAIRICSSKYQLIPTIGNLVDISVMEEISKPNEDEDTADHKARVQTFLESVAKAACSNEKMFKKVEASIAMLAREKEAREAANQAVKMMNSDVGSLTDKLDAINRAFQEINQYQASSAVYTLDAQVDAMRKFIIDSRKGIKEQRRLMTLPPALGGIAASIRSLDKGLLHVIKGATKGGKSSVLGQISEWVASCGWKVAYFALEDDVTRRVRHQVCRLVDGADYNALSMGDYEDYTEKAITIRQEWDSRGGAWFYVHCPGKNISWIINEINKLQNTYGLDAVFVDYLQKVDIREFKSGNDYAGYTSVVELFKQRIEDHERPLVGFMASQVTEGTDGTTHTRGTKDLEMRAQRVISIKNNVAEADEVYGGVTIAQKGQLSAFSTLKIEYNNDGPAIEERLMFWRPRYSFYSTHYLSQPNAESFIPVMRAPNDMEKKKAKALHEAYRKYGASGGGK